MHHDPTAFDSVFNAGEVLARLAFDRKKEGAKDLLEMDTALVKYLNQCADHDFRSLGIVFRAPCGDICGR